MWPIAMAGKPSTPRNGVKIHIENARTGERSALYISGVISELDAERLLAFGAALYARGWNKDEMSVTKIGTE